MVEFTTLVDYLHLLRAASEALQPAGRRAIMYLAAAVSDFYIPDSAMVQRSLLHAVSRSLWTLTRIALPFLVRLPTRFSLVDMRRGLT